MAGAAAGGVRTSPNIWHHPEIYELENRAADPHGGIESAMRSVADWSGRTLLDVGCGTGFHLSGWAGEADRVIGIEPHPRWPAGVPAHCPGSQSWQAPPSRCPCPSSPSTWRMPVGPTSWVPAANRAWPSWTGSYAEEARPS